MRAASGEEEGAGWAGARIRFVCVREIDRPLFLPLIAVDVMESSRRSKGIAPLREVCLGRLRVNVDVRFRNAAN